MSRRTDFQKILNHEQPERLILDLGGCPQSNMSGKSMYTMLEFLGYDIPGKIERLRFGKTRRLDERLLKHLDTDTRSVGDIYMPVDSQYKIISEDEYIDAWGIKWVFKNDMYWEQTSWPLKGATVDDLDNFRWPNPDSIDLNLVAKDAARQRPDGAYRLHHLRPASRLWCIRTGMLDVRFRRFSTSFGHRPGICIQIFR